jgi:hypothetical protein
VTRGPKPGHGTGIFAVRYDRAEIAAVALASPDSMAKAVAEHFHVNRQTAYSLMNRARSAGHPIPLGRMKPGQGAIYDRAEVAKVALANPGRMTAAVADRFHITRGHAATLIDTCRKLGFDIPRERAKPTTHIPRETHVDIDGLELACSCGWCCDVTSGVTVMARHTLTVHRRTPTASERTPRNRQDVAA